MKYNEEQFDSYNLDDYETAQMICAPYLDLTTDWSMIEKYVELSETETL